jgi:hypothetical protein
MSFEFRDPYNLKSPYTSFVRPKLEYARCVWNSFYDVRVDKVERALYDMLCVVWVGRIYTYDLPPYEHRCALLRLDTLVTLLI